MERHLSPARRLALAATAVLALAPATAVAQESPTPSEPPTDATTTTTLPLAPTTSVPITVTVPAPPPSEPPASPEVPTGEAAEIPDPEPTPTGSDASVSAGTDTPQAAAVRAEVIERLVTSAEPLVEARRIEAAALGELAASERTLGEARASYDAADVERRASEAAAASARTVALDAQRRAEEAAEQLRSVAVAMYLDPPGHLEALAALSGDTDRRLAAGSLLAAQSDVARDSARRTQRFERIAEDAAAEADAALEEASAAQQRAEARLAELEQDVARRADLLRTAAVIAETLSTQLGIAGAAGSRIADLVAVEQVVASGSVTISIRADGSWSVEALGFPRADDLVRIEGTTIRVHRLIAGQVASMIAAAAADGVRLDGWGHRDAARQVELRRAHCGQDLFVVLEAPASSCRPPTARPGRSMHERGLAIDFAACGTRATPCYQWLSRNAGRFGLLNLPSEPWHWSTNGN
jgi:hypothetical protein